MERTTAAALFATLVTGPARRRELAPDETLFRAGARVSAIFVIETGRLRLVRTSRNGHEVTLLRAGAGEAFAEASLFSERYHCDARADVLTVVLEYPKAVVLRRLAAEPARMMDLLRHLSGQVQALRARAEILSVHGAADRLIAWLRLQARADVVELQTSWKQLAAELGLTHEALYRALKRLEDAQAIEREGTVVRLRDRGA